ncbi:response regulator [Paenibacillus caui]|uniref:response regulator n=1 Tax=Paenibacillus caui TaxID=2873927 RepID=UPI001CA7FB92|nr:response regulator [Paenibacillus caui]
MKVLIVDDEEDVRDSIRLLVDWDALPIDRLYEAPDGVSAMEIIKREKPEIIFTDMKMPQMDGMALVEWIHEYAPSSKTIVISGYDDYPYVRHTMKYGGIDYLLKPINQNELLESLHKAIAAWKEEESKLQVHIRQLVERNQSKPVFREKMLSSALSQPSYFKSIQEELVKEFNWSGIRHCQVVVLNTEPLPRGTLTKFESNPDLLYFLITNVCNEVIGETGNGYAFRHTGYENEIVFILLRDFESLPRKLAAANEAFRKILHIRFHFAAGQVKPFPEGLCSSFDEARQTLKEINYLQGRTRLYTFSGDKPAHDVRLLLADYGDRISLAIRGGNQRQIEAAVGRWIEAVNSLAAITPEHLNSWRSELYVLMSKLFLEEGAPPPFQENDQRLMFPFDEEGTFDIALWKKELTMACMELAAALRERKQKDHHVIHEIKAYIDSSYDQNLMLQDIADLFFISREYISRKFKQEFQENISDYIERLRVENAKVLLSGDQYSISQIAGMVGYQDSRYFSKIFGRLTGLSPREFRKKNKAPGK